MSYIPENNSSCLKTKFRNTYEKYSKAHVPCKYKKAIDQLSRNKELCILKQDKARDVILIDRTRYTDKCFKPIQTNQFIKQQSTRSLQILENS